MPAALWIGLGAVILSPGTGALLGPVLGLSRWVGTFGMPGLLLCLLAVYMAWCLARELAVARALGGAVAWLWWPTIVTVIALALVLIGAAVALALTGV